MAAIAKNLKIISVVRNLHLDISNIMYVTTDMCIMYETLVNTHINHNVQQHIQKTINFMVYLCMCM